MARMRTLRAAIAGALITVTSLAVAQAPAPAGDAERARVLKARGDVLIDDDRPGEAIEVYEEAYRLSKDPALLYNRGRALQMLKRYVESLELLERFDRDAPAAVRARVPGMADLLAEVRSHVATLLVESHVAGSRIAIDGTLIASTPMTEPLQLAAGPHRLEVSAEGYQPFSSEIDLRGASLTRLPVTLTPTAPPARARLRVTSAVRDALVDIDGAAAGRVPAQAELDAGSHRVAVTRAGYERAEVFIQLQPGQHQQVDLDLHRARVPLTGTWWFWTGVGVLVAGSATAAIVALTTERPIDPGNLGGVTAR